MADFKIATGYRPYSLLIMLNKDRLMQWIEAITGLLARYPRAVALFGFVSGVCSFILVDRQQGFARVLAVITLISWVWLILENLLRERFARRFGWNIPLPLLRYATQLVHQESLFFALPFFLITTSWNSGQALFSGLLIAAALTSIIDPLYYRGLSRRRWLFLTYHMLTLFSVLLAALPILLQQTTTQSYQWALAIAVLLAFPSLLAIFPRVHGWRTVILLGLTVFIGLAGWGLRIWVPPATLWMTDKAVSVSLNTQTRMPGGHLARLSARQVRQGLYAFTAINAPRGLRERIYHLWLHNGREIDRIALDVSGGRKEGYRAWTHKRNFPAHPEGDWQVRVVTDDGQMIGTLRFTITAATGSP